MSKLPVEMQQLTLLTSTAHLKPTTLSKDEQKNNGNTHQPIITTFQGQLAAGIKENGVLTTSATFQENIFLQNEL